MKIILIFLAVTAITFAFADKESNIDTDIMPPPLAPPPGSTGAKEAAPLANEQTTLKKMMDVLFEHSKHVNSEQLPIRTEARRQLDISFDWERAALECIGQKQWKKQPRKNTDEFRQLLHEVIAKSAYSRLDKLWKGATHKFTRFDISGGGAHVTSKFFADNKTFILDYFLHRKGNRWVIYDLAYEGERYSTNINQQITAFLKENSFQELLGKLRRRRDELSSALLGPHKMYNKAIFRTF